MEFISDEGHYVRLYLVFPVCCLQTVYAPQSVITYNMIDRKTYQPLKNIFPTIAHNFFLSSCITMYTKH